MKGKVQVAVNSLDGQAKRKGDRVIDVDFFSSLWLDVPDQH
jgi:hypothetical protein